jgi:hypothetical protein
MLLGGAISTGRESTKKPIWQVISSDLLDVGQLTAFSEQNAELLDAFWSCHDPTRERNAGEPHRSTNFFHDEQQQLTALATRDELRAFDVFSGRTIATEMIPATEFFPADEEHQQYLAKLGRTATCSVGEQRVTTRLAAVAATTRRDRR